MFTPPIVRWQREQTVKPVELAGAPGKEKEIWRTGLFGVAVANRSWPSAALTGTLSLRPIIGFLESYRIYANTAC